MAKNDESKKITGHEPDYVRALREAKANMPKVLDRETGEERDVFSPAPVTNPGSANRIDALTKKIGHVDTKPEDKAPKMTGTQRVTIPGWLATAMDAASVSKVDIGDLDTLVKLINAVNVNAHKNVMSFIIDEKNSGLTVLSSAEERDYSKKEQNEICTHVAALAKIIFRGQMAPETEKSPAKQEKTASTKKSTEKKTASKKEKTSKKKTTAPIKEKKSA